MISSLLLSSGLAQTPAPPPPKTLVFSGRRWVVKDSAGEAVGPGGNVFDSRNASLDGQGRLRLEIRQREGRWTCGEVVGEKPLGYGTYRWVVESGLQGLSPSAVLGLFTWSDAPDHSHQEIDIEASAWGVPGEDSLQFVVQPYEKLGSGKRQNVAFPKAPLRLEFTWKPGRVGFVAFWWKDRQWQQFMSWSKEGADVPPFVDAAPRMNLWLFRAEPPQKPHQVVLRSFTFSPFAPRG